MAKRNKGYYYARRRVVRQARRSARRTKATGTDLGCALAVIVFLGYVPYILIHGLMKRFGYEERMSTNVAVVGAIIILIAIFITLCCWWANYTSNQPPL